MAVVVRGMAATLANVARVGMAVVSEPEGKGRGRAEARGVSALLLLGLSKQSARATVRLCETFQRERCRANSLPKCRVRVLHLRALMRVPSGPQ